MEHGLQIFCYFMRLHFCSIFAFLRSGALGFFWNIYLFEVGRDLQNYFCFCYFLVFGLVSGYDDCNYNKANHTHNYHHFQVLQPEFPLEFAGLLFKL